MKIYKISVFLIFVTLLALLYVHQQVQLLKISYKIETNEKGIATLLDQHRALIYNITRLKSPVYLEKKFLATNKDYAIPKQWQVIGVSVSKEQKQPAVLAKAEGQTFGLFKMLVRPREALAKTIK